MPAAPNKITSNGDHTYSGAQMLVYERVQATIELIASDYECARVALACAVRVTRE